MAPQAGEVPVVYHPAGRDAELRAVWEEVRAGRWMGVRDLLRRTRESGSGWADWTRRTQVLGAAAAESNVVEIWLSEEPGSIEALVMTARVRTERTLSAYRQRPFSGERVSHHLRDIDGLAFAARQACRAASEALPADPVPWVCLLALALVDPGAVHAEHRKPSGDPLLGPGPWGLMEGAEQRDAGNREAWHRLFKVMCSRGTSPGAFARYADNAARMGSAVRMLPLYASMEQYRSRRARHASTWLHWNSAQAVHYAMRAYTDWFCRSNPADCSELDLNYLAHALHAADHAEAAHVFEAIGPYATPVPWRYVVDDPADWQERFLRCRTYSAARGRHR
ncbi:hypothetical protein [Streptomyces sp. NPDC059142]|uniref:hypothetical protein n=1 Tax=Streptomyces sp. NPDC059142 TaxID=3346739 RepID=UPI00367C1EC9